MDAAGLLSLITAEAQLYDHARGEAERAATRTQQLEATTRALDACFAVLEFVALLRVEHPEWATDLAREWRQLLLLVHTDERRIVEAAATSTAPARPSAARTSTRPPWPSPTRAAGSGCASAPRSSTPMTPRSRRGSTPTRTPSG